MDYTQFKHKFQSQPIIISKDIRRIEKNNQVLLNQFNRWQKKGLLVKLKRGTYLLNKNDRKINPGRYFIANKLYEPSYVSMETALSFYGFIPERVYDIISVTTKKTARFKNDLGLFVYRHIRPQVFEGVKLIKDENGFSVFIAEPEKAILDFLYFNAGKIKIDIEDVFMNSYRFQNTKVLKKRKIMKLAAAFGNKKLLKLAKHFCNFIEKEANS